MKCPACKTEFANPVSSAGGKAKVKKGFAVNKAAQRKAQRTLKRIRKAAKKA